jgi:xylulose-5-phosphate/fructose-6-phosphate phosphoketolase
VALAPGAVSDVRDNPANLKLLEDWLRSYRPQELFDADGRLVPELASLRRAARGA